MLAPHDLSREPTVRPLASTQWLWSGALASLLSSLALAWHGRQRHGSSVALLNAPSHWLYGDRALRANMPSWRFTFWGMLIHHLSSLWWAALHEVLGRWLASRSAASQVVQPPASEAASAARDLAKPVALAAAVTTLAWLVDTRGVPPRLRPGFERRASRQGMALVYGAFGAGLLIASLTRRHRQIPAATGKTCRAPRTSA